MPDYDTWDLTNDFTVAQASCLWCEVDPGISFTYQKSQNAQIAAIEQMLASEIRVGRLQADSTKNPLSSIGDYSQSILSREALKGLAERKGLKPKFLFPSARPARPEMPAPESLSAKQGEADPYRTGVPGRRTIAHLIEAEFDRRAKKREVRATLTAEADALAEWAAQTHPNAPRITTKTIQNRLRDKYRNLTRPPPK